MKLGGGGGVLYILFTGILEFAATKFSICSTFYQFVLTKNKNLYSLNYVLKHHI